MNSKGRMIKFPCELFCYSSLEYLKVSQNQPSSCSQNPYNGRDFNPALRKINKGTQRLKIKVWLILCVWSKIWLFKSTWLFIACFLFKAQLLLISVSAVSSQQASSQGFKSGPRKTRKQVLMWQKFSLSKLANITQKLCSRGRNTGKNHSEINGLNDELFKNLPVLTCCMLSTSATEEWWILWKTSPALFAFTH